jgi:hypothetical protein
MDLDKILNLALNKALIGKNRIKHINSNEIADFVNKHLEAINYTCCSEQLKEKEIISFDDWREENCKHLEGDLYSFKQNVFDSYDLRYVYMREFK